MLQHAPEFPSSQRRDDIPLYVYTALVFLSARRWTRAASPVGGHGSAAVNSQPGSCIKILVLVHFPHLPRRAAPQDGDLVNPVRVCNAGDLEGERDVGKSLCQALGTQTSA